MQGKYFKMKSFKIFLENFEQDTKTALKKLPKPHQKLVKDYKFKAEDGCTLKHYPDSIGLISLNGKEKIIKVAAPWHYGREFAFLHEIGHLVWQNLLSKEQKEKWKTIANNTKNKLDQNTEELFCHAYAATYSKHPPTIHSHPSWVNFIKKI
jgi:hypothetical protein